MPKLVVGPINKGLRTDRLPFNIDNDSFPTLINAYQWRGRLKRKRGTAELCRLQRIIGTTNGSGNLTVTISPQPITAGISSFMVVGSTTTDIFTDPGGSSPVTLLSTNIAATATLNYTSGVLTIAGSQASATVLYFPSLPVMGIEDLVQTTSTAGSQFPGNVTFDTVYSYIISTSMPYPSHDVSFYKNPPTGTPASYVQKATWTPSWWNGKDYQQFWTTNYQGALWATNGIDIPFTGATIGMQFAGPGTTPALTAAAWASATTMNFTVAGNPLVVGDFVFANEFTGTGASTLNLQTGYVTTSGNTFTVTFPNAVLTNTAYTPGILQYLTNRSNTAVDCLRWFDGDPTTGSATTQTFVAGDGWVNFMPPVNNFVSNPTFEVADLPLAQYYLVGARLIVPFKDRLLFIGAVVQSSTSAPFYLQDTVIYSQNGTAYYTASFTGDPLSSATVFNPLLVPGSQTATAPAYFGDASGFGGWISAGIDLNATTVGQNEDALIIGFADKIQTRFIYTGSDIIPFNFFIINAELGSNSTFSSIVMDEGVISIGSRGFIFTSQVDAKRFDIPILDQVFEINLLDNGTERTTAQRDFQNEWIYFSYTTNMDDQTVSRYPNQTLQYNYREQSWAIFNETYTTYGQFKKQTGQTWASIGLVYPTWNVWDTPWNEGDSTLLQPTVIAGNQQGFVLLRDEGTGEANSLYIQFITANTITCPNHGLNNNDYIYISGAVGAISSQINGNIFSVFNATENTFMLSPAIMSTGSDYLGGAYIQRMYVPFIQSRQFPVAWEFARKVRIGLQQYLLSTTANGQIQLLIFLSQDNATQYNNSPIVPALLVSNSALIYSTTLFTCPEQYINTVYPISLGTLGNGATTTFTFNYFTLFNTQGNLVPGSVKITVGTVATFTDNGQGGFTATGTGTSAGSSVGYLDGLVTIVFTIAPTAQATTTSFQYYQTNLQNPTSASQQQIWHRLSTSLIGDTVQVGFTMSDTQMRDTTFSNQFSEIEIHGFVMDVTPSQVLA
jgi:hypothetical protein